MIPPEDCSHIQEIRTEIDAIDREVIAALARRFAYVKAAAKFKTNQTSVQAPERFNSMLQQRRLWAEEAGLNPEVIEQMYRDLVNYFINEELKHWESKDL